MLYTASSLEEEQEREKRKKEKEKKSPTRPRLDLESYTLDSDTLGDTPD